jgi:hypothetical protein
VIYWLFELKNIGLAFETVWCEHGLIVRILVGPLSIFVDFGDHEGKGHVEHTNH